MNAEIFQILTKHLLLSIIFTTFNNIVPQDTTTRTTWSR